VIQKSHGFLKEVEVTGADIPDITLMLIARAGSRKNPDQGSRNMTRIAVNPVVTKTPRCMTEDHAGCPSASMFL